MCVRRRFEEEEDGGEWRRLLKLENLLSLSQDLSMSIARHMPPRMVLSEVHLRSPSICMTLAGAVLGRNTKRVLTGSGEWGAEAV
jgi:hypothetical protein